MWRWFHGEAREDGPDSPIVAKRWPEGLIVSEALARCPPADDTEREALVALFAAIEHGAITGAVKGVESDADRLKEEGAR